MLTSEFLPCVHNFLVPVQGEFRAFAEGAVVEERTQEAVDKALQRLKSKDSLGEEYVNIYEPAVPACELEDHTQLSESPLPISIKSDNDSAMTCLMSGRRSGIVEREGKLFRLKGCGDLGEGFPVKDMEFPEGGREVRGCCFHQTVLREQLMTSDIDHLLKQHGYESANKPIGYWKYTGETENTLPLIPKYCGLFETLSEKRVGSHLLGGIDLLLSKLQTFIDIPLLEHKLLDKRHNHTELTTTDKLRENRGPTDDENIHEWTLQGVYKNSDLLLDVLELNFIETVIAEASTIEQTPFDETLTARRAIGLIAELLWTVGREMGEVKRIFQDANISWGYFIDHNPFEPHCNAHPNNFAVLPPGYSKLLAPLDFDMAFHFKGFINTIEGPDLGKHDFTLMQSWVNSERIALEEALSGIENMANFNYGNLESSILHVAVKTAFRDTLILGFREGFERMTDRHPITSKPEIDRLVRHCLELTVGVTKY